MGSANMLCLTTCCWFCSPQIVLTLSNTICEREYLPLAIGLAREATLLTSELLISHAGRQPGNRYFASSARGRAPACLLHRFSCQIHAFTRRCRSISQNTLQRLLTRTTSCREFVEPPDSWTAHPADRLGNRSNAASRCKVLVGVWRKDCVRHKTFSAQCASGLGS